MWTRATVSEDRTSASTLVTTAPRRLILTTFSQRICSNFLSCHFLQKTHGAKTEKKNMPREKLGNIKVMRVLKTR